jgi:hypothetical protein
MLRIERSSTSRDRPVRIPAGSVVMWLCATCLVAATPVLYFAAGASDSASEADRIGVAALPLLGAWPPLALSFGVIRRRRIGSWGLPVGPPGRRAALLIAVAAAMLAAVRTVGAHSTIYGDTAWALLWLACCIAWVALWWTSARRFTARQPASSGRT